MFGLSDVVFAATQRALRTCSGYGCDHTDPSQTFCNSNAYTATQGVTDNVLMELRWGREPQIMEAGMTLIVLILRYNG
jgi:hypothetical protein